MNKLFLFLFVAWFFVIFFYVQHQQFEGASKISSQQIQLETRARSIANYGYYEE